MANMLHNSKAAVLVSLPVVKVPPTLQQQAGVKPIFVYNFPPTLLATQAQKKAFRVYFGWLSHF